MANAQSSNYSGITQLTTPRCDVHQTTSLEPFPVYSSIIYSELPVSPAQTLEQARIEVEREDELECIRQAALALTLQREEEARQVSELNQAAVEAEREKEELRRQKREEANRRRVVKEKVACSQLVRQVLPLSLGRAFDELSAKSWTTPSVQQVGGWADGRDIEVVLSSFRAFCFLDRGLDLTGNTRGYLVSWGDNFRHELERGGGVRFAWFSVR